MPPQLFRNRTFTVVNVGTLLLYTGIGLTFFLVAYELQVAVGWSALEAGLALLPTTVAHAPPLRPIGALAQRIGPRLQLTVGPILTGAGMLLLTRIDAGATWATDVLPGSLVLGLGLVTYVAPLTATVMAATDPDHVSTGSGVNNAVARGASLAGLAVIPVIAALPAAMGADEVTDAVRTALVIAAALAVTAGVVMSIGLAPHVRTSRTVRRVHCAVEGPPIQPDPQRCPLLRRDRFGYARTRSSGAGLAVSPRRDDELAETRRQRHRCPSEPCDRRASSTALSTLHTPTDSPHNPKVAGSKPGPRHHVKAQVNDLGLRRCREVVYRVDLPGPRHGPRLDLR